MTDTQEYVAQDATAQHQNGNGAVQRFLSAVEILGLPDHKYEDVFVPEWNTTIRIRAITSGERDEYEGSQVRQEGNKVVLNPGHARARLVVMAAVTPEGAPLFQRAHIPALSQKNAAAVDRLWDVARRLAGMTDEDVAELEKNSNGQSDDFGSV